MGAYRAFVCCHRNPSKIGTKEAGRGAGYGRSGPPVSAHLPKCVRAPVTA
jgi:hypothetical protein